MGVNPADLLAESYGIDWIVLNDKETTCLNVDSLSRSNLKDVTNSYRIIIENPLADPKTRWLALENYGTLASYSAALGQPLKPTLGSEELIHSIENVAKSKHSRQRASAVLLLHSVVPDRPGILEVTRSAFDELPANELTELVKLMPELALQSTSAEAHKAFLGQYQKVGYIRFEKFSDEGLVNLFKSVDPNLRPQVARLFLPSQIRSLKSPGIRREILEALPFSVISGYALTANDKLSDEEIASFIRKLRAAPASTESERNELRPAIFNIMGADPNLSHLEDLLPLASETDEASNSLSDAISRRSISLKQRALLVIARQSSLLGRENHLMGRLKLPEISIKQQEEFAPILLEESIRLLGSHNPFLSSGALTTILHQRNISPSDNLRVAKALVDLEPSVISEQTLRFLRVLEKTVTSNISTSKEIRRIAEKFLERAQFTIPKPVLQVMARELGKSRPTPLTERYQNAVRDEFLSASVPDKLRLLNSLGDDHFSNLMGELKTQPVTPGQVEGFLNTAIHPDLKYRDRRVGLL